MRLHGLIYSNLSIIFAPAVIQGTLLSSITLVMDPHTRLLMFLGQVIPGLARFTPSALSIAAPVTHKGSMCGTSANASFITCSACCDLRLISWPFLIAVTAEQ